MRRKEGFGEREQKRDGLGFGFGFGFLIYREHTSASPVILSDKEDPAFPDPTVRSKIDGSDHYPKRPHKSFFEETNVSTPSLSSFS